MKLLDEARASISDFCINECKAYCCRKGYLVLSPAQVPVVAKNSSLKLLQNGMSSLSLNGGCPSLKDNKCTIYNDPLRPKACSDFPIFKEGNVVRFSPRCLAVRENKFYGYIKELMQLGYIIVEPELGFTETPELL